METNQISIREIRSAQLDTYKDFFKDGLLNDEEHFRITPADEAHACFPTRDMEDSFTLGAYSNGTLAGVVSFERDGQNREKLRHKATLFRMYVSPHFRGQGVAKKLMAATLGRAKMVKGIEQVNLTVITDNNNAKMLYRQFGFQTFALEKDAIKWKSKYFAEEQMVLFLNKDKEMM